MSAENVGNDVPQTDTHGDEQQEPPEQVYHDCHACGETVDVLAIYDGRATNFSERRCPDCYTELKIIHLIADGIAEVEELDGTPGDELELPSGFRQEIAERLEERDDPAETSEYLRKLGVVR